MTGAELIEDAVSIYQSYGTRLLSGTAGSTVVAAAAVTFANLFLFPSLFMTSSPESTQIQASEVAFAFLITLLFATPVFASGISYSSALVAQMTADFVHGQVPDLPAAERRAKSKVLPLMVLGVRQMPLLLIGFIAGMGMLFASASIEQQWPDASGMIAGLGFVAIGLSSVTVPVALCRMALAPPAVVFEDARAKQALKRSVELLKGQGKLTNGYGALFGTLGILVVLGLIGNAGLAGLVGLFGLSEKVSGFFSWLWNSQLWEVLSSLTYWFLTLWFVVPIWCVTTTLLYFERRARVEGHDIEVLAANARRGATQARFQL